MQAVGSETQGVPGIPQRSMGGKQGAGAGWLQGRGGGESADLGVGLGNQWSRCKNSGFPGCSAGRSTRAVSRRLQPFSDSSTAGTRGAKSAMAPKAKGKWSELQKAKEREKRARLRAKDPEKHALRLARKKAAVAKRKAERSAAETAAGKAKDRLRQKKWRERKKAQEAAAKQEGEAKEAAAREKYEELKAKHEDLEGKLEALRRETDSKINALAVTVHGRRGRASAGSGRRGRGVSGGRAPPEAPGLHAALSDEAMEMIRGHKEWRDVLADPALQVALNYHHQVVRDVWERKPWKDLTGTRQTPSEPGAGAGAGQTNAIKDEEDAIAEAFKGNPGAFFSER